MKTIVFNRSIQMRLYSMHKREFGLVFLAFFACFGMSVFIGLAGILNKKSLKNSIAHYHHVLFEFVRTTYNVNHTYESIAS